MRQFDIVVPVKAYQWNELTAEQQDLLTIAKAQTSNSYCPYSHFSVGAAALLANGTIVRGANQENAAYPSGLCAERSALFAAGANYPEQPVTMLAVACKTGGHFLDQAGAPCGGCRQVMVETEQRYNQKMQILLYGEKETLVFESAKDMLPYIFDSSSLS